MKTKLIAFVALLSSIVTLGMTTPASAQIEPPSPLPPSSPPQVRQSSIGPSVLFGNGQTAIGVDSKFSLSDNISLRPFIYFPSNGTDFGTALTYDIPLRNNDSSLVITPFVGGSVDYNSSNNTNVTTFSLVGGADVDLSDSLRLKGSLIVPLSTDRGQGTGFSVGAGFRF
ncbi:hypothetical protein [Chamaesiphon polymorphus]|uniref:Outer membrane protein beta-barrel domain-containing protein n=1 Tax=Chamaesiphon polymorphus CCALA 037 TaxID=2107692 RepID=A0A2T1GLL9_9CYAN|nr:hypothetical protein [Chamaesiphon polymorphus]PSB58732.1 hypothetical protein C7B77_03580 [Chamaesiphon polymorphus CCALA 037]